MKAKNFIKDIIDGKLRGAEARRVTVQLFGKDAERVYDDATNLRKTDLGFVVVKRR